MEEGEKKYSEREFKLGQLAAFVDGEGTVAIQKRAACVDKRTNKKARESFSLRMSIGNTDFGLIDWLCENFGGSFSKWRGKTIRHSDGAEWVVQGHAAFKLLEKIRPFLIIKGERADVGIEFWKRCSRTTKLGSGRPIWMVQRQIGYYEKMKALNQKGPQKKENALENQSTATGNRALKNHNLM